jgi:hypothetical protein
LPGRSADSTQNTCYAPPTVCQVINLVPAGDGTIVHLRPLPGLVDDYRALVERALAS